MKWKSVFCNYFHIFTKDPQKEYMKKIRFYPSFFYAHLDRWLKKMSRSGWHIVHCGRFTFLFEKGKPAEKEYFTYGSGLHSEKDGYYSIELRYPFLKKTYGVKKKYSKINANEAKALNIVEIDLKRIDITTNIGYLEMVHDRNHLYRMLGIRFLVLSTVVVLLLILVFGLT